MKATNRGARPSFVAAKKIMQNGLERSTPGGLIPPDLYKPLITAIAGAVAQKALEEKPPVRPRLLDAAQVGIIIGRTERGVMQAYHKGKIPGFKLMGKIVFDEVEIHNWINEEKDR
ncbi:MAG: hypothetical protein NTX13_13255 [Acidobacteria bacterium]|nr:hypothetical protein [Acidobacteriota bacterium]